MGFWSRLFARQQTVNDKPRISRVWMNPRTSAGAYITPDTALKNAVVWRCVQYLSCGVAQLPWHVMREINGGSERMSATRADYLLSRRPCPETGSFSWRQQMLSNALLHGNAYAEIERDNRGRVFHLWPIHPSRVAVKRDANGVLYYEVWNSSGGMVELRAEDMFHLRGLGDGPVGYSVIAYAAESIGWAQATETFGATYFGEGMNPSGIVTTEKTLSVGALEIMRKDLQKLYKGPKGDRTMILDAGMDFKRLASTPEDSQFIETRQHQVEEICRWFGVPPHKVMHLLRATFSNIEHQSIEVVVDSVSPWIKAFEEEADYKLFGENRNGYFTKIDTRALLRGDHASRAQYYKTLFELGVLSTNQILALEDFNSIGPDGEHRYVSANLQPLGEVQPVDNAAPSPAQERALNGQRLPN